jgi:7-cyano-7-deazaguanine tRNA-ribosyltransferase
LEFEVKEADLLGRVGTLRTGGRTLETPCLFPVVHPASQAVPLSSIAGIGFKGVMTNSYIIAKRRREEARAKGIHSMLGFDGTVMTDSGGYQALEYGNMDLGYRDIASLQAEIGSDLAVTLDRPTGYPQGRAVARDTVEYSLRNALATMEEFGGRQTTWVGPVQGGLHLDLLKRSARSLVDGGFGFLALGSPVQVMENYMFADLARMIIATRKVIPYSVPLHLFGAGHPLTMAMAVALGCDTFDSASYILFARNGRYMTHRGVSTLSSMKYLPCSCTVCAGTTPEELLELDHDERTKRLSLHNLHILWEEVEACKEAISEGRLWDLVEEKSMAHPRLREAFTEIAHDSGFLASSTPAIKERGLFVRSAEDLVRPEVETAKARARWATRRTATRAYLVPREGRVPGHRGKTGKRDLFRYDPILGVYPAELDFVYPFGQVTSASGLPEGSSMGDAAAQLRKSGYKVTVVARGRNRPMSRRNRRGVSPSPPSSSARPRSPRRL